MTQSKVLTLSHISYTYPGSSKPVFSNVSLTFSSGWTGIVGNNGCGKTALAHIACSTLVPNEGSVTPSLSYAYCEQDAGIEPPLLFDFACDYSNSAQKLRSILHLDDELLWRFNELSCGEQKKIQVACALWMNPELLILDESTNHVDEFCRHEIQEALRQYSGIGLLISHDRVLLDELATACLCFEAGTLRMRPGGYTQAKEQAHNERLCITREKEAQKARVQKLQVEHDRPSQRAAQTASRLSARSLDKHDSDGRAKRRLAVFTGQDGKAGSLASSMDARLQKEKQKLANLHLAKEYSSSLWLDSKPSPRKTLLHLPAHQLTTPQGESRYVPTISLENNTHLAIKGPNGIGKSTLLREIICHLTARQDSAPVSMLYLPQELTQTERAQLLNDIKALPKQEKGQVLSLVAQLNSDPNRILQASSLSPGEARKLLLAQGILQNPEIILMDEPTNHLDIHSIEALENALATFPGALVLISHDTAFRKATTNETITIDKV